MDRLPALRVLALVTLVVSFGSLARAEDPGRLSVTALDSLTPGGEVRLAVSWKGELPARATVWADLDGDGAYSEAEALVEKAWIEDSLSVITGRVPEWAGDGVSQAALRVEVAGASVSMPEAATCSWSSDFYLDDFDGPVHALEVYDDGSGAALYAGGSFTTADGQTVNNIARWSGGTWTAMGVGLDNQVLALEVYDDGSGPALFAGGDFNNAGGAPASKIAKWNGTTWSALGTGTNSTVWALRAHNDGSGPALFAGGSFTVAGGLTANYIARWNGSAWSVLAGPSGTGMDNAVRALEVYNDGGGAALFAGGEFSTAGGVAAAFVAKWNGSAWSALTGGGTGGSVYALTVYDDGGGAALYAGGAFITAGAVTANRIAKWNGGGWSALSGPSGTGMNGSVSALGVYDDGGGAALFAGGPFGMAGGLGASGIAKWQVSGWSALPNSSGGVGVLGTVNAVAAFDDGSGSKMFVGGSFSSLGGAQGNGANKIAAWDGVALSAASSSTGAGLSDAVTAIAIFDDGTGPGLYAGGIFRTGSGKYLGYIARWDGITWSPLGTGLDNSVYAFAVFDDGLGGGPALYAGGAFSQAGGMAASRIARWNGTSWSPLGSGLNSGVNALVVFDDGLGGGPALYAGGFFTLAGGVSANRIARWNGTSWSALGSGLGGTVHSLVPFDDGLGGGPVLVAGGTFGTAGGIPAANIAKWNGTSWAPLGGGTAGTVYALATYDDGLGSGTALFAGGFFGTAGGLTVNNIAKWNGLAWSGLSGPSGTGTLGFDGVRSLTVSHVGGGPQLIAGGEFTSAGGVSASRIASWDGTSWSPLGAGVASRVNALSVYDDGNGPAIFTGGHFHTAGGVPSRYLAKWTCTCSTSHTYPAGLWQLTGLACNPGASNTVSEVFGDDLNDGDYLTTWVMWERDEGTDSYNQLTLADTLSQGSGYWLKTLAGGAVGVEGSLTPTACPGSSGYSACYDIALTGDPLGRWNLISHPYASTVTGAGIRIVDGGGTEYTLADAETNGFVEKTLHEWSGGAYQAFDGATPGMVGSLDAFDGFWVKAFQAVTLRIPAPGEPVPVAPPWTEGEGWMVRLIASSGELEDRGNVFGVRPEAERGPDAFDLVELEPFGDDWLTVVFPGVGKEDKEVWGYTSDFRPEDRWSRRSLWRFAVRSSTGGREVTLRWEGPAEVLERSVIVDESTGARIEPRPGGSYRFLLGPGETERSFRFQPRLSLEEMR